MNYYFVKIVLRGVSPMIWRRLRIPGNASLAMLHECIQINNDCDDENLHQLHIYDKDYGMVDSMKMINITVCYFPFFLDNFSKDCKLLS
jgi:hypothetical protein